MRDGIAETTFSKKAIPRTAQLAFSDLAAWKQNLSDGQGSKPNNSCMDSSCK